MRLSLIRFGLLLTAIGGLPLLIYVAVANMNGDPNPNPVGPGILFMFCFWPGVAVLSLGVLVAVARRFSGR